VPRLASVLCVGAAVLVSVALAQAADVQADFEVHFVPRSEFSKYIPDVVDGHIGFFCLHWNTVGACTRATVLIASDGNQAERVHAIREEITQALGLMQDSWTYPDSMFYQGWTPGVHFAEIDKTLIQMLYRTDIRPGMTREQARSVLKDDYTKQEIDYFCEIAFGSEYVANSEVIRKWLHSPTLQIHGQLNNTDVHTVNRVVKDLNELLGRIQLRIGRWSITPAGNGKG
jgi:hypothetical protein